MNLLIFLIAFCRSVNRPAQTHARYKSSFYYYLLLHMFNGPLSRTTRVSRYQKGKTNLDFTEARVSECQWHQLGHMQVCTLLQTDNHASTPPLSFLQAGCPFCLPNNSVKALKAFIAFINRPAIIKIRQNSSKTLDVD